VESVATQQAMASSSGRALQQVLPAVSDSSNKHSMAVRAMAMMLITMMNQKE